LHFVDDAGSAKQRSRFLKAKKQNSPVF
jgi:ribosomal protein L39E